MSTPKHTPTPGPWLAVIDRCRGKHGVISQAAAGYGVAIVPENEANARLIAAAPALLAACRMLASLRVTACERCEGSGKQPGNPLDACHACGGTGKEIEAPELCEIEQARAAIALVEPPTS